MIKKLLLITAFLTTSCLAAEAVIDGPDRVQVGDFIVLSSQNSQGSLLIWIKDPRIEDIQSIECKDQFATAIDREGEYFFTLVAVDGDMSHAVAKHKIVVTNDPAPPPIDYSKIEKISYEAARDIGDGVSASELAAVIESLVLFQSGNEQWFLDWRRPLNDAIEEINPQTKQEYVKILEAAKRGLEKASK